MSTGAMGWSRDEITEYAAFATALFVIVIFVEPLGQYVRGLSHRDDRERAVQKAKRGSERGGELGKGRTLNARKDELQIQETATEQLVTITIWNRPQRSKIAIIGIRKGWIQELKPLKEDLHMPLGRPRDHPCTSRRDLAIECAKNHGLFFPHVRIANAERPWNDRGLLF